MQEINSERRYKKYRGRERERERMCEMGKTDNNLQREREQKIKNERVGES